MTEIERRWCNISEVKDSCLSIYRFFFFQAEDRIRYLVRYRGLGDVYKRQVASSEYEREFFGGIEDCIKEKDIKRLSRHIHKFRGSISHFQAGAIDEVLSEIKVKCKERDFSGIEKLCGKLRLEYIRLKECLMFYINR